LALARLICPIVFSGDLRPYLTVQDSDYKEVTTRTKLPANMLLGVTNPYFIKALEHWPHMISLITPKNGKKSSSSIDLPLGIRSKYQPFVSVDKKILKKLEEAKGNVIACEQVLQFHFFELTQSFLLPFERYFQTLVPSGRTISPWKGTPRVRGFQIDGFLKSLNEMGPQLAIFPKAKEDWIAFYKRFLKSASFKSWFRARTRQADKVLKRLHLKVLCEADVKTWMIGKNDIEVVDFLIRVQEELKSPKIYEYLDSAQVISLKSHIDIVIDGLPDDLRLSILASQNAQ